MDLVTNSGTWPDTQQILDTAVNRLNQTCLAAQGFQYPAHPAPRPASPEDEEAIIDLAGRRARGYEIASPTSANDLPPLTAQVDAYAESLSVQERQRFTIALLGAGSLDKGRTIDLPDGSQVIVQEDGCAAASQRRLAGDVILWARINYVSEYLSNQLTKQLPTAPSFQATLVAWRSCMTARGHKYESPDHAWKALKSESASARAEFRQREVAVAVADGECQAQAHLPASALATRRELAAALPVADRRTLAELAHYRDATIERAKSVLCELGIGLGQGPPAC